MIDDRKNILKFPGGVNTATLPKTEESVVREARRGWEGWLKACEAILDHGCRPETVSRFAEVARARLKDLK